MADRNEGALQAAVKALEHAVMPAVNPADPLAAEQLKLTLGYLKLLRSRFDRVEARRRFELEHQRAMAQALHGDASALGSELAARFERALARADAAEGTDEVRAATADLAAATSGLVRAVAAADPARRRRVELTVARHSRSWIDAQRAWFAPLGFELHPARIPTLDDALDPRRIRLSPAPEETP